VKTKRDNPDHATNPDEITGASPRAASSPEESVIPVIHEELEVGTRRMETGGGVRVNKTVEEREETVDPPLAREEVDVERVIIDRPIDTPVGVRYEGDTMIVPVLEEVLVVQKQLVLKEEIRITRRRTELRSPQRVIVRREHADVERMAEAGMAGSAPYPPGRDSDGSLLEQKRRQDEELRQNVNVNPGPSRK
jgi:uncharacterized protein (TIGR02271 family)